MTKILLGTYTRNDSKGIYSIDLDEGQLKNLSLVVETSNPTYLDYDASSKRIFSVLEKDGEGGIGVFDFDGAHAKLDSTYINSQTPPCYVSYDKENDYVYDANYHQGRVHVQSKGDMERVYDYGAGSHAHFVDLDPKTSDLFVCDLGLDAIHKYRLLNEIATYKAPEGMGPRHLVFHPSEPIVYVLGELNNTVQVLRDHEFDFECVQTISTLPNEGIVSSGGAIRISKDGRFVYASNRGHDSIVMYRVKDDFTLELMDFISVEGQHPRDFALSLDEAYLVVGNRDTNNLTLFERDADTGLLTLVQKDVHCPEVVSILFLD